LEAAFHGITACEVNRFERINIMKTTRRNMLQNAIGWGIPAGLLGQNMLRTGAGETAARPVGPATRLSAASATAALFAAVQEALRRHCRPTGRSL
jgi:hypothetical protein